MLDVSVQKLINTADDLLSNKEYKKSIGYYLKAMKLAKEDWDKGVKDELWQKRVIFTACNGMGMAYANWGKSYDAIENFEDAILFAPTEEAKQVAQRNLDKYKDAVKKKLA